MNVDDPEAFQSIDTYTHKNAVVDCLPGFARNRARVNRHQVCRQAINRRSRIIVSLQCARFGTLISDLAVQAVKTVCIVKPDGRKEASERSLELLCLGLSTFHILFPGNLANHIYTRPKNPCP